MEFDGWTVDRVSGEISRGDRAARLPQQPLRILMELFDHAGTVVTRDQLVKVLWPAGIVDFDNGLNVAMRKLRVALDDVGDTPRYIETLPRVGYRFVGKPVLRLRASRPTIRIGEPPRAPHCPRTDARCARRRRGAVLVAVVGPRYVASHSQRTRAGVVPRRPAAALAPRHRHHRPVDREVRGRIEGGPQLFRSLGGVWNGDLHRRHPAEADARGRHTQGARRCRASHRARSR